VCVIMYKPIGVAPLKKEWLENAVEANRDGWGVLIRTKKVALQLRKVSTKRVLLTGLVSLAQMLMS